MTSGGVRSVGTVNTTGRLQLSYLKLVNNLTEEKENGLKVRFYVYSIRRAGKYRTVA